MTEYDHLADRYHDRLEREHDAEQTRIDCEERDSVWESLQELRSIIQSGSIIDTSRMVKK